MKKFLIAVMAAVCLTANAQNARHSAGSFTIKPTLGLAIGVQAGEYSGGPGYNGGKIDNDGYRYGLNLGVDAEYYTSLHWLSVSAGLLYTQQGWEFKNAFVEKIDYLNIPILANFYVTKGLSLSIGLQPGFLLSAKHDDEDVKDYVESFNFSMPIGIAYEFENGITIDARWNTGWSTVNKNSYSGYSLRTDCLLLDIGYKFDLAQSGSKSKSRSKARTRRR